MQAVRDKGATRRMLVKMGAGAITGAALTVLFMELFGKDNLDLDSPGTALAVIGGLIFALLGIVILFGVSAPSAGAHVLNVENADELRDQRKMLGLSALSALLVGVMLIVLASAGEGMAISRQAGAIVTGLCFAGVGVLAIVTRAMPDELMKRVSHEASSMTLHVTLLLFGGWAALAHLGYVEWVEPLTFFASLVLIELLAIFWISGRRGMLTER